MEPYLDPVGLDVRLPPARHIDHEAECPQIVGDGREALLDRVLIAVAALRQRTRRDLQPRNVVVPWWRRTKLELAGWDVRIADAVKARGLAPLACKTDRIDCWVLPSSRGATSSPRSGCPAPRCAPARASPLPAPPWSSTGAHSRTGCTRSSSSTACPTRTATCSEPADAAFARLQLPEPWTSTLRASRALIDRLDAQIDECERELRRLGLDHPYIPLLTTIPGIAWCSVTRSRPRSATSVASPAHAS